MSQIESHSTISDNTFNNESSTGITWFFDRIGDPTILENYIPTNITNLRVHLLNRLRRNTVIYDSYNIIENITTIDRNLNNIINTTKKNINIMIDKNMEISEEQRECCICMDEKNKKDICKLNCSHTFCITCCNNTIQTKIQHRQNDISCPLCRTRITIIYIENEENKNNFGFYV
jgi:hypothetical protein